MTLNTTPKTKFKLNRNISTFGRQLITALGFGVALHAREMDIVMLSSGNEPVSAATVAPVNAPVTRFVMTALQPTTDSTASKYAEIAPAADAAQPQAAEETTKVERISSGAAQTETVNLAPVQHTQVQYRQAEAVKTAEKHSDTAAQAQTSAPAIVIVGEAVPAAVLAAISEAPKTVTVKPVETASVNAADLFPVFSTFTVTVGNEAKENIPASEEETVVSAPAEDTVSPVVDTVAPAEDTLVSGGDDTVAPVEDTLVGGGEDTVAPAEDTVVSGGDDTVAPVEDTLVGGGEDTVIPGEDFPVELPVEAALWLEGKDSSDVLVGGNMDDTLIGGRDEGRIVSDLQFETDVDKKAEAKYGHTVHVSDVDEAGDYVIVDPRVLDKTSITFLGRVNEEGFYSLNNGTDNTVKWTFTAAKLEVSYTVEIPAHSAAVINVGAVKNGTSFKAEGEGAPKSGAATSNKELSVEEGGIHIEASIAGDVLTGGEGSDTFMFTMGDGFDVIIDFGKGDHLVLKDIDEKNITGLGTNTLSFWNEKAGQYDAITSSTVHGGNDHIWQMSDIEM